MFYFVPRRTQAESRPSPSFIMVVQGSNAKPWLHIWAFFHFCVFLKRALTLWFLVLVTSGWGWMMGKGVCFMRSRCGERMKGGFALSYFCAILRVHWKPSKQLVTLEAVSCGAVGKSLVGWLWIGPVRWTTLNSGTEVFQRWHFFWPDECSSARSEWQDVAGQLRYVKSELSWHTLFTSAGGPWLVSDFSVIPLKLSV